MVRLNREYIVEVEPHNYTLKRDMNKKISKVTKLGDEVEEDVYNVLGYYGNLQQAIKGAIADMNIRKLSRGEHTLEEAIAIIAKNNEKFDRILKKATKEIESK